MTLLHAKEITKKYKTESSPLILDKVDLLVEPNSSYAITGPSGVGKTTLLHILGALDSPTSGDLQYGNIPFSIWDVGQLRQSEFGFIFQSYFLLDDLTVLENILLPAKIARKAIHKHSDSYQYAIELIERLNLQDQINQSAKSLSGGEMQRACIIRALINDPKIIFADEPTGNLDEKNSFLIQDLLISLCKEKNKSLIVVTHDYHFAKRLDHIYKIEQKKLLCLEN